MFAPALITAIDFADPSTVVTRGVVLRSGDGGATSNGMLKRTADGGRTWTSPFPSLQTELNALDFAGANNGLLGGAFSVILRTTTGGQ